jgi:hypothetical protein
MRRTLTGGYTSRLAVYLRMLANARTGPGFNSEQFKFAESHLLEAHKIINGPNNATDKDTRLCRKALADLYAAWDQAVPGKGFDQKAREWQSRAQKDSQE